MSRPVFRPLTTTDHPILFSSWLESFRPSHWAGLLPGNVYYDTYRRIIEGVLARPGVEVLIAAAEGEVAPNDVYGWICVQRGPIWMPKPQPRWVERDCVHYVYVKEAFRGTGVAHALLRAAGIDPVRPFFYSFRTPGTQAALKERRYYGVHDPDIVRYPPKQRAKEKQCA